MEAIKKLNTPEYFYNNKNGKLHSIRNDNVVVDTTEDILDIIEAYLFKLLMEDTDLDLSNMTSIVVVIPMDSGIHLPFWYMYEIRDCVFKLILPETHTLHMYSICIILNENPTSDKDIMEIELFFDDCTSPKKVDSKKEDDDISPIELLAVVIICFIISLAVTMFGDDKSVSTFILRFSIGLFCFLLYYKL